MRRLAALEVPRRDTRAPPVRLSRTAGRVVPKGGIVRDRPGFRSRVVHRHDALPDGNLGA